jgi:carboxymethylenebutenolidase
MTTQTKDGPMRVYVARPDDNQQRPAIVVIQEIFGVNDNIQTITRRFAEEGFVAGAPEIFHRFDQKQVPYSEGQTGMALRNQLSDDMVSEDANATVSLLKGISNGRVGIVGFCYGGRVAYLMATRNPELQAVAPFYGGRIVADDPSAPINATANIRAPMILFFGENDQSIPMEQVQRIREELTKQGKQFEIHTYPGAGHGFMASDRAASYNAEADADAWPKVVAFFKKHLGA